MRPILVILLFFIAIKANSQSHTSINQPGNTTDFVITPQLGLQFGTIAKLEVQVIDGNTLPRRAYMGEYLLKVNSVNGVAKKDTVILLFSDETQSLKKAYAGEKLTLMAYETGNFTGIPDSYFKYQPIRQDVGFGFRHYLIVVSNLTNKADR
jgi:hypothetical protein